MLISYIIWQFISGPKWLVYFSWNIQRMLLRLFSVPLMLKTLVSHWHRDAVQYKANGIGGIAMAFAWNQISRGIGFFIRSAVLFVWLVSSVIVATISIFVVFLFIAWPILIIIGIIAAIMLLMGA